jgi:hypothetical protein
VVTDCNVVSRRADTAPQYSARSVIDDRQQGGICEYTGIEGWIHSQVGADKVGSGLVAVVRRTTHLVYVMIYPLFMDGFQQCTFAYP